MSDLKINPYPGLGFAPAPSDKGWLPLNIPTELHPDTVKLMLSFAEAMMQKLLKAQQKYGYTNNWADPNWMDDCRQDLHDHVEKGDPLDVAAYCAFLWSHGESTNG